MAQTLELIPLLEPIPALEPAQLLVPTPRGKVPDPELESLSTQNILQNILRSRFQGGIGLSSS